VVMIRFFNFFENDHDLSREKDKYEEKSNPTFTYFFPDNNACHCMFIGTIGKLARDEPGQ
jgi:hypothetical protein